MRLLGGDFDIRLKRLLILTCILLDTVAPRPGFTARLSCYSSGNYRDNCNRMNQERLRIIAITITTPPPLAPPVYSHSLPDLLKILMIFSDKFISEARHTIPQIYLRKGLTDGGVAEKSEVLMGQG